MDSFTCGTCRKTLHLLDEFTEHKKLHEAHNNLAGVNSVQEDEHCISRPIYESNGDNDLLGYLIVEDSPMNDVCIEIDVKETSEDNSEEKPDYMVCSSAHNNNITHDTIMEEVSYSEESLAKNGLERPMKDIELVCRKGGQAFNSKLDGCENDSPQATDDNMNKIIYTDSDSRQETGKVDCETSTTAESSSSKSNSATDALKHKNVSRFGQMEEIKVAEANGASFPARPECDSSIFSDEIMDLMDSNLVLANSETTNTSSSVIYTLVMNDSSFMLLGGGSGSTCGPSSRMYVCHRCKKFSTSQVEIINHITYCHPEDLIDVNRCIGEFSSLTNFENDANNSETSQVVHESGSASGCLIIKDSYSKDALDEPDGYPHSKTIVVSGRELKEKAKRKVGRPRKEDKVKSEEKDIILNTARSFTMDGNFFVCTNCKACFPKRRQFDKHKCNMWKENQYHSSEKSENLGISNINSEDIEDYFPKSNNDDLNDFSVEEECEEEWTVNRQYKPGVKNKQRVHKQRIRGRPPKVDSLMEKPTSCDLSEGNGHVSKDGSFGSLHESKDAGKGNVPNHHLSDPSTSALPMEGPKVSLNAIATLPLYSNPQQQERLQKWIAQIDLSVVDKIIERKYPDGREGHESVAMYMCKKCNVFFRSLIVCRRHCAKHLSKKAFTCPDCDFATANIRALYAHYRNHTQNLYACDKCDFRARIKTHFRDHLETHNPSRYICRLCQRPYSTCNSLRSHIHLYHPNKEGKEYRKSLREKNQKHKVMTKFFQCPVCDKVFGEKSLANWHLATHSLSTSKDYMRCEVCDAETLNYNILRKHMKKHKVVYICCVCSKPQLTVNGLRSHLKTECSVSQPETFKHSLLLSFTSLENFPIFIANKKFRQLVLHDNISNQLRKSDHLADSDVSDILRKQMQEVGYRQIYQFLDGYKEVESHGNHIEENISDAMKIIVDTKYAGEKDQQTVSKEYSHLHGGKGQAEVNSRRESEQTHFQVVTEENIPDSFNDLGIHLENESGEEFLIGMENQDPTSVESDQHVVVISNVDEEQHTVIIEDGHMLIPQEETFVIINEESQDKQHVSFPKFFIDNV